MNHFSVGGLSWELSVLSKAVAYKNLSGAAHNVGISQPQLSRIVGKLETELRGELLDRGSRRKSGWTPLAFQIAEVYQKSVRSLDSEVEKLLEGNEPRLVHVGALEGLIPLAVGFGHQLLDRTTVETLDLNVYDLNVIEEKFLKGDLDFIFSVREPGRKKYKYCKTLGYQNLELVSASEKFRVMSSFEFGVKELKAGASALDQSKSVISNSLAVRRHWIEKHGGTGTVPSAVRAKKISSAASGKILAEEMVYLFGQDSMSPTIWENVSTFQ